jgi:predicted RecB family nuclease
MTNLIDIEGIGPVYAEKLTTAGVTSVEDLLAKGSTPAGRKKLADDTAIAGALILRWVNHADLFRVKGIQEEYADLLEAAGEDTVVELSKRIPANLLARMTEVNADKNKVRRLPSQAQIEGWVELAKTLPRVVQY